MSEPIIVFLIHGTFAGKAGWTASGSSLRIAVESVLARFGYRVIFEVFEWTGQNSSSARIDASCHLNERFVEVCAGESKAPIFFIGHSHGGSVVAYFLRNLSGASLARVSGAAFLSTPFVAARVRPDWRELIISLSIALAFLVFTTLVALSSCVDYLNGWSYSQAPMPFSVVALLASFCLTSFALAELLRRVLIRWGNRIGAKLDKDIRVHETVRIEGANHLFLRATGDEAAAALAIGQFAIWILGKLQLIASRGIGRVWSKLLESHLLFIAAVFLAVLYSIWVGTAVSDILSGGFSWRIFVTKPMAPIPVFGPFVETSIQILAWPFVLAFLAILLFSIFLLCGISLCLIALRAAGWVGFADGLLAEIAIEPLPLGAVVLHHLDWNSDQPGPSQRHSYSYSNSAALEQLCLWICRRTQK